MLSIERFGPTAGRTRDRRGSTFLVVVVLVTIVLTLAAVLGPGLVGAVEVARVDRAATRLRLYERAIRSFETHVGDHPGTLRQVTRQIVSSDRNSCGGTYNNQQLKNDGSVWLGPYVTRVIPGNAQIPVEIGTARDTLVRRPAVAANPNDPGLLIIQVTHVPEPTAKALDRRVDGTIGRTAGTVRWTDPPDADGFVTVEYTLAITGC